MRSFLKDKKTLKACRIYSMLKRHARQRRVSFHTPGHKIGKWDITELPFSDNLASPTGCIATAQAEIASLLGAEKSFLLTDGSTSGVYSILHAARTLGVKRVAAPALSHQSFFKGCELMGLTPVLFSLGSVGGIPLPVEKADFLDVLKSADALFLTSPDYYGNIPELAAVKEICERENKWLLIDGAHGGHLRHEPLLYAGTYAHLWVDGVHKSLPALTQGAVVSAKTKETAVALERAVSYFRTTSPSYPIMASVEYAVKYPRNLPVEKKARELCFHYGRFGGDWTKLIVRVKDGVEAQKTFEKAGVDAEFQEGNLFCFYLSPATPLRALHRLEKLLKKLAVKGGENFVERVPAPLFLTKEEEMRGTEEVELIRAEGRICAEQCGIFPPCLPVLFAGEKIGREKIEKLLRASSTFGLREEKITVVKK
ncbi:MAG: aminotransferase class I/II-fold pyridoxal phosphate-dependent enzyme [Clostridia bacterium]|nr:aminotransferase class I/II-fold pyridoxal phosphate-dependent enzyme [Clostridia bacterium]